MLRTPQVLQQGSLYIHAEILFLLSIQAPQAITPERDETDVKRVIMTYNLTACNMELFPNVVGIPVHGKSFPSNKRWPTFYLRMFLMGIDDDYMGYVTLACCGYKPPSSSVNQTLSVSYTLSIISNVSGEVLWVETQRNVPYLASKELCHGPKRSILFDQFTASKQCTIIQYEGSYDFN